MSESIKHEEDEVEDEKEEEAEIREATRMEEDCCTLEDEGCCN